MPDRMSERMSERMSDRMSECMPENMSNIYIYMPYAICTSRQYVRIVCQGQDHSKKVILHVFSMLSSWKVGTPVCHCKHRCHYVGLLFHPADTRITEGSLEVKLPTIWTDEKQSRAEAERRERLKERRSEKRKSQKKEDADARKGRKVAKHCVFPMI